MLSPSFSQLRRRSVERRCPGPAPAGSQLVTLHASHLRKPQANLSCVNDGLPIVSSHSRQSTASTISTELSDDFHFSDPTSSIDSLRASPPPSHPPSPSGKKQTNGNKQHFSSDTKASAKEPLNDPALVASKIQAFQDLCRTKYIEEDLVIGIEVRVIYQNPLYKLLSSGSVRWSSYRDATNNQHVLRIKCMATSAVHDATYYMGLRMNNKMMWQRILTERESEILNYKNSGTFLPEEEWEPQYSLTQLMKPAAVKKVPDAAFAPDNCVFPPVVLESGKDEGKPDLLFDKDQWMYKGRAQVVSITDEVEDLTRVRRERRERRKARRTKRLALADDNGDLDEDEYENDASKILQPVSSEEYQAEHSSIDVDKYVGEFRVFMEFWRRGKRGGKPKCDGEIVIPPAPKKRPIAQRKGH